MFYVYIIKSISKDKFYIGHTSNLRDRLLRHNQGRSKATISGKPWILVYSESFKTRREAYRREREIKFWKSSKMIQKLIDNC